VRLASPLRAPPFIAPLVLVPLVLAPLFGAPLVASLLLAPSLLVPSRSVHAAETEAFARPPELERDVRFWIRIYTEVTTDGGLLHDDWNLGLVYEVLHFDPAASPGQRERQVMQAKARYAALLRRFAAGDTDNLSRHERRILHAFGEHPAARDFQDAIERVRFQLGQADRFHEGLIRAEAWETHIARVLEQHGVPREIAALPHVESSFNPAAYSKVGAAGLWQFMPATAKRFMRVDGIVDQRLDPYAATEAAANLMLYNYRLLGSWPLAVTAYNHGPAGLKRAQDELGTSDIAVIVKRYQGATFGFASRNFYVAFLAALEVDRNAEKYFGPLTRLPDAESTVAEVPDYVPVEALARAFKVDLQALRVLNPALRPPVWSGARWVPRGYGLRIPDSPPEREIAAAWERLPAAQRYLAQRNDGKHKVRRGETLAGLAAASGVSTARLIAANGWSADHELARGDLIKIPLPASRAELASAGAVVASASGGTASASGGTASASGGTARASAAIASASAGSASASADSAGLSAGSAATAATVEHSGSAPSVSPKAPLVAAATPPPPTTAPAEPATAVGTLRPPREPVSQRQTDSVALLPASTPTGNADATDYSVGAGDTVVVQADETLGHFATWSGVDAETLRRLNRLDRHARVTVGRRVKLDLSHVGADEFVAARRAYHQQLQEAFFAEHRIAATESYGIKRGDSLWTIAAKSGVPVWLIAQYNPQVDLNEMRPGTAITLPRVEGINRQ